MENIKDHEEELLASYSMSKNRILFFDYDGTLVPIQQHPNDATPTTDVTEFLTGLSKDSKNCIVLISGREKEALENWFGDLPITLVAEHGGFYKEPNQKWQSFFHNTPNWKTIINASLRALVFQYKGSFVEDKVYSIAWHYRAVADRIQEDERKQIISAIRSLPNHHEFKLYDEDCTVEIRTSGVDKGKFAGMYIWNKERYDFVMAIGDGKTDEDLFEVIGKDQYTIKVGKSLDSLARFFIDNQSGVLPFFNRMMVSGEKYNHGYVNGSPSQHL